MSRTFGAGIFSLRHRAAVIAVLTLLTVGACAAERDDGPTATPHPLAGGVLATFDVTGERFKVWVTNEQTIEDLFSLQSGESSANIPNGVTRRGPGQADHNEPYSWHMDPEDISMAEVTIELCDGSPSYVDENIDEWQDQVGRYCPWSADLVSLEDYR